MAKRRRVSKVLKRAPKGKRIVDAGRNLSQARSMAADTNAAAKGDPSCPRGAKAVIRKNPKSSLPYEIWVNSRCRWV